VAEALLGLGHGRQAARGHPPERGLGLAEALEPLPPAAEDGGVGVAVDEGAQRLERLPDRHVHDQAVVAEGADRRRVAVLGLEAPHEPGAGVGDGVDRLEGLGEPRHPRAVERLQRQRDVDLRQVPAAGVVGRAEVRIAQRAVGGVEAREPAGRVVVVAAQDHLPQRAEDRGDDLRAGARIDLQLPVGVEV
jgi:hypothetical protein